jgi:DNA topoisomerase VI subunit A
MLIRSSFLFQRKYFYENGAFFNQSVSNDMIADVACLLNVSRRLLGVSSNPCGSVAGNIKIRFSVFMLVGYCVFVPLFIKPSICFKIRGRPSC